MSTVAADAYAADGRLRQMMLGNGLWETRDYQTPGTTTRFKLGMSAGTGERLDLGYDYHATQNNGNLTGHTIARSGTTWTQTFGYDGVNRLKTATETNGYNREFGYDAFGNRWVPPNTNPGMVAGESHEPRFQTEFDAATNRMTTSTVDYDAAGNQTLYSPHTLAYDAENRLFSMTHASSGSGTYLYDGQGRRVKKTWTAGGGTAQDTYYVYDIAGRLAAEYGTASNPDAATPATLYPFTDMLGSVRAVTNAAGTVVECYDYLPFGRMLNSSDNGRSATCHPDPDTEIDSDVSQKFTGQVRDEETRLDYFKARYMSAPEGRFMSIDPLMASADAALPQSWNRYSYVMNNPLRFVDPTGESWLSSGRADNPYMWVDTCADFDGMGCLEAVAVAIGDTVRIYGSGGRNDITVIRPPMASELIDVNDIANHPDSSLVNVQEEHEDFLSAKNAAGLFSVSVGYRSKYPQDGPLSFSGGSFANGGRVEEGRGESSHFNGNNFDLRYMGPGGQAIQHPEAATVAHPGRITTIIELAGTYRLGGAVTAYPDRFGGIPAGPDTRNAHMDHIHFNRGR